ncbi:MAG: O-antigen ligase family protein, partial [Gemmatimonadota bacterium]
MTITVLGLVLIPVGLVLALGRSRLPLLHLTVFFAPFTASAIVNFGAAGFGIQPGYYFATLYLARSALDGLVGERAGRLSRRQVGVLLALGVFTLVTALSVTLVPWYGHDVRVLRPSGRYESLAFTGENVTQLLYVVFVVGLAASVGVEDLGPPRIRSLIRTLILSGVVVCVIGWIQLTLHSVGIPYPAFLFNSNESFSQLYAQTLPGLAVKRVNSVAPEPSMLARFLLIPTAIAAYAATDRRSAILPRRRAMLLTALFVTTLVLTTSSTALVGLTAMVLFLIVHSTWRTLRGDPGWFVRLRRQLAWAVVGGLAIAASVLALAYWWLDLDLSLLAEVANIVLLEKLGTTSGQVRLDTAIEGLELFLRFPLLGVGWGSYRTFDLGTNLLVSVGVLGFACFAWIHVSVLSAAGRLAGRLARLGHEELAALPEAMAVALITA